MKDGNKDQKALRIQRLGGGGHFASMTTIIILGRTMKLIICPDPADGQVPHAWLVGPFRVLVAGLSSVVGITWGSNDYMYFGRQDSH